MPGLQPSQQDIEQFVAITQASQSDALHFLEAGTTLEGAIEDYYTAQIAAAPAPSAIEADDPSFDQDLADDVNMSDPTPPTNTAGGPRTLSGEAAEPLPAGWGQPERSRFGRIQHNQDGGGGGHSDNEDDDDKPEELYAGGRDSGLAVENPDKPKKSGNSLVDNILRMARENGPSSPGSAPSGSGSGSAGGRSVFRGTGNTLGSDEVPSTQVPDASSPPTRARAPAGGRGGLPGIAAVSPSMMDNLLAGMFGGGGGRGAGGPPAGHPTLDDQDSQEEVEDDDSDESVATRNLTFWRNGFSIEDGPLLSYDDPANQELLKAIESGRAPLATFGVKYNQRLNVVVAQRRREDYEPPAKKPARPFGGSGNRLGSATPDITGAGASGSSNSAPVAIPAGILVGGGSSSAAPSATGSASGQTKFEVDESKPTTNVQLRLGDGTRLVARVNLTHTIGDLRNYVSASRPDSRSFILQTTFPSRELSDVSETIEGAKLQNAVVVQRFT